MIATGFEDSSVRVWRNDNQPLGTPAGHERSDKTKTSETTPDEYRFAVLRGHSGPVYATSFSPDHRFLLSCSADSSIRLWSLSTRHNVVLYESHQLPVWDV